MKTRIIQSLAALWLLTAASVLSAAEPVLIWQIGKPDTNNAEFALAPGRHAQFKNDGFFVVGESDSKRDWPYVHPGPGDAWAGNREHSFLVLFGLKAATPTGECKLELAFVDTHSLNPPKLRIVVNGRAFERDIPKGAGDASINGEPFKGKFHQLTIPFPAALLKTGDNDIRITAMTGSWVLYDWIGLTTPAGNELAPVTSRTLIDDAQSVRALVEKDGKTFHPVNVTIRHFGGDSDASVRIQDGPATTLQLKSGIQTVELAAAAVSAETKRTVTLEVGGKPAATREITLKPVRKLTVYLLPHSHTDIGYTDIQSAIEAKQVTNLIDGIAYARKTANYPEGARFVWNVEVTWAADLYLRRLNATQRTDFFEAVKKGQVVLNGMYLNELTGLCRPEELIRLFRYTTKLAEQTGVPIDSAMISDVPGNTWGTVTAMAQSGIKYFSTAPNYFDRIGTILREWENKPFYWVGPDGKSKVLVWIPFWGYAMSHRYGKMSAQLVDDFYEGLEKKGYPYDIAYARWSGHGDNAVPDPTICEFVKDWNAKYAWPHFIISGTGEAFSALEKRYGSKLPLVHGDWTPYWEDGAGSSALETAMNRQTSDRLAQTETLFALRNPSGYPMAAFEDAWNNALLYSEHTWGAWCSVSEPERKETKEQWEVKKSYADKADVQSRELLERILPTKSEKPAASLDVYNTLSWPRTELVTVSRSLSSAGDRVTDDKGKPVPSQRLTSGELVFLATDVPPMAARRYQISAGQPFVDGTATAKGTLLDNGIIQARIDEKTGGIAELTAKGIEGNFADTSSGETLNDFLYLPGDDLKNLKRNGPVKITVGEKGPLVASMIVESDAPGCKSLRRELRLVAGMDYIECINLVDKARLDGKSYMAREGKESVNFGFAFNVPDGDVLLDLPLGVMRPELDQMPSACKNWFSVGRWADVSNSKQGITWVTLDAPLVQVGGLTANLLNSQTNPDVWRKKVDRSQKLYSWAMNNHWGTNYRAYQDGPVTFRFILRPHRKTTPAEASRFATGFTQPLQPGLAKDGATLPPSLLRLSDPDVLITALKPSDDGKALIIRLLGASSKASQTTLTWAQPAPKQVWLSDTSEKPITKASGAISVPAWGIVTLRVEMK